jgi:hypothetical protein
LHPKLVRGAHVTHDAQGKVGAVGMTDEAAMGYYLVKWLSVCVCVFLASGSEVGFCKA